MDKRLYLIDGHALMFRMYYAFLRRPMVNSQGMDTSVIFGFTKYLLDLIAREQPTHLAVAFDPPAKTFRHEAYPEYKANRSATPEVIRDSLEPLKSIVEALDIPVLMFPGFEADDVIGSMAREWSGRGMDVYMVSPDKDLGQLIADHIFQVKPGKAGAADEIFDTAAICAKFGIDSPSRIIDILAIWGDASDNVPGVKGIGEVGAKKLVGRFGSLDTILSHLDSLPPKQAAALQEAAPHLEMSRFLVTIRTDIATGCTEESLRLELRNPEPAKALLAKYECPSLIAQLSKLAGELSGTALQEPTFEAVPQIDTSYHTVTAEELTAFARKAGRVAMVLERGYCLATTDPSGLCLTCTVPDPLQVRDILEDEAIAKVGYRLKENIQTLRGMGIELQGQLEDLELMHYLINPETSHKPEALALAYFRTDVATLYRHGREEKEQPAEPDLFSSTEEGSKEEERLTHERCIDALLLLKLHDVLKQEFAKDASIDRIYRQVEMPLLRVLADMEYTGVRIDTQMLASYGKELTKQLRVLEDEIREMTGEPDLNISSPMQLGVALFEKLKLDPKAKKTRNGRWSTDEETLTALADRHPVVLKILEFRGIKKLISTYIDPFPSLISPRDGRVHTTFNQALTATGRLSSAHPNLQNIPIRTEMGREIRKAFVPSVEGNVIVSADYSQIELRLMAAMSKDPDMIEAFSQGRDIHTATASKIYKIDESQVTPDQRRTAKTANFGIIYGISAFGLSQRLGIARKEAALLIEDYFHHYPSISDYLERTKAEAREKGYVTTIFGRRRYIKDINSRNAVVRANAERNAINAPIQGSAADIIKIAMNRIAAALKNEGLQARLILQVHDELVLDTPLEEVARVQQILHREMEHVVDLPVPLTIECNYGANWLEAH